MGRMVRNISWCGEGFFLMTHRIAKKVDVSQWQFRKTVFAWKLFEGKEREKEQNILPYH